MKKWAILALLVVLLVTSASVVQAKSGGENKIKNKWDLSGSFVAHPGYSWAGMAEGATWAYKIHIKEAMDEQASVGSIHFSTDGINVVGHVDATSRNTYWGYLGAVGKAGYNGTTYYFMFLYKNSSMWFALSETPYEAYWPSGIWPSGLRDYQLHSLNITNQFPTDYHAIH